MRTRAHIDTASCRAIVCLSLRNRVSSSSLVRSCSSSPSRSLPRSCVSCRFRWARTASWASEACSYALVSRRVRPLKSAAHMEQDFIKLKKGAHVQSCADVGAYY